LEADGPIEDTFKFKQRDIKEAVDQQAAAKVKLLNINKRAIARKALLTPLRLDL
jgi:hypothetical protein